MRQILSTKDVWTSGIVNVPLEPALANSRYTFFELDTKDINKLRLVWTTYLNKLGSVFIHETMNGYHFYNLTPIDKEAYGKFMRNLKYLNPECPMTTLRIIPNKWMGEYRYWRNYQLLENLLMDDVKLKEFSKWLIGCSYNMIKCYYQVVRYPMEECPICKKSDVFHSDEPYGFFCKLCGVQTKGRLNK